LIANAASGQVLEINIWDPEPGKSTLTFQYGAEAKAIMEKLGTGVEINVDQFGKVHYVTNFESWEAWGAFQAKLAASKEWDAFYAPYLANPTAELVQTYMGTMVP